MTLAEMLVVLALMSIVGVMFTQLYVGTIHTTMFLESNNDLALFGQEAVNEIKLEIMQSRRLFQNDTVGQGYLAALALPAAQPLLTGSRLPEADPNGVFRPDASGETRTGNALLAVRELEAITATVDHDGDASTADVDFLADVFRFQLYYLTKRTEKPIEPFVYALDLVEFESQPYADYFQLSGLPSTYRTEVAKVLYAAGLRFAWDPGQDAANAFFQIGSDGSLTGPVSHQVPPARVRSLLPQLRGGRITGAMDYSVGITGTPPLQTIDPVSVMAQESASFPSGFEVQVIGPSGARKVLVRLMLVAQYQQKLTSHANSVSVTVAEF
ncbi:MAG: hypothetical protein Kow0062_26760 [Acidobacteriota bacterium]